MRVAAVNRGRCQPKKCNSECIRYCPVMKNGTEVIEYGEDGKIIIHEELCTGCGICVHKCPYGAISIINLPEQLDEDLVHQYGENGFRLFRLPTPKKGQIVGILGQNGIGKTTAIGILSGNLIPNLGNIEEEPKWDWILDKYSGTELGDYLKKVANGEIRAAMKPQYVDKLPKAYKGKVGDLLKKVEEKDLDEIVQKLDMGSTIKKNIDEISGGELQKVAIAATMVKDADIYFFDEPSSYLDISQRLNIAKIIRELAEDKIVVVVEHDLAILDFLSDLVHLMYGKQGAYGVMANPRPVRNAINIYLSGFLPEENIRFRDKEIKFHPHPPKDMKESFVLIRYGELKKRLGSFELSTSEGKIHQGEVIGIVGPNATGKTTFVKMLAGVLEPDDGWISAEAKVSYKPQYIKADYEGTVYELLLSALEDFPDDNFFKIEIAHPLRLKDLYEKDVQTLSGGELQRVAIALCLGRDADIYLLDEPSAYLDAEERMNASKVIKRVMDKSGKSAMVVDHDVYLIDMVSDRIMVFSGEPGVKGRGEGPFHMREGMNRFLKNVGITFRRDNDTKRPRINKLDSRLDREQKSKGEYYYS
jgi:ATP-binding cassette subfamily E protein 1